MVPGAILLPVQPSSSSAAVVAGGGSAFAPPNSSRVSFAGLKYSTLSGKGYRCEHHGWDLECFDVLKA
uniref:Uncharacterized protein n=1 Tax=Oryza meridionalis TaxID=40149 RepID=A0A0E0BXL4_9ORYZ